MKFFAMLVFYNDLSFINLFTM